MRRLFAFRAAIEAPAFPRTGTLAPPPPPAGMPPAIEREGGVDRGIGSAPLRASAGWVPAWDGGVRVAIWNHESAQPTIDLVLNRDPGAPRVVERTATDGTPAERSA